MMRKDGEKEMLCLGETQKGRIKGKALCGKKEK